MSWWSWILIPVVLITVFVLWDLIFCGGGHCRRLMGGGLDRKGKP